MPTKEGEKVAVIGSGITGIGAAWALSQNKQINVTVYEAADRLGGHTNTILYRASSDKQEIPVDTGFIVFNKRTYPNFMRFLNHLQVPWQLSDMSFAVSRRHKDGALEWAGNDLSTVFA